MTRAPSPSRKGSTGNASVRHLIARRARLGHLVLQVGDEWVREVADTAVFAVGLDPREVRELAVDGEAEDLRVEVLELAVAIRKLQAHAAITVAPTPAQCMHAGWRAAAA